MGVTKSYKLMTGDGLIYIPKIYRDEVGILGNTVFEVTVVGDTIMLKKTNKKDTEPTDLTKEEIAAAKVERTNIYSSSQIANYAKRNNTVKCSMCGCLSELIKYKEIVYCKCCIGRVVKKK